jgi:hypothetical protein
MDIKGSRWRAGPVWQRNRTASFSEGFCALSAQLLETRPDRREIIGGARTRPAVQLFHSCANRREIIGSPGSSHGSSGG